MLAMLRSTRNPGDDCQTMSVEIAAQAAYIVAALLFILALAGLSHHETATAGNTFGIAGMVVALVATIALAVDLDISAGLGLLLAAMVVGAGIGLWRARVVEMTGMPELIALLHSFVGLAAVLVGWNGYPRRGRTRRSRGRAAPDRGAARHPLRRGRSGSSSARSPSPARSWRSSSCPRGSSPTR